MAEDKRFYQDHVDTEALSTAIVALTKIEELEKHTNAQYMQLDKSYAELKQDMKEDNKEVLKAINTVHSRVDRLLSYGVSLGSTVIMLCVGIIAYLLINGTPWTR